MKALNPTLYFDLSDIVLHAMKNNTVTGIQRSVLKIIESFVREMPYLSVWLLKHPVTESFVVADLSFMRGSYDIGDFYSRFDLPSGKELWRFLKLYKYKKNPVRFTFHSMKMHVKWAASAKLRTKFSQKICDPRRSCLAGTELVANSAIVSLGAGWGTDYYALAELAETNNTKSD